MRAPLHHPASTRRALLRSAVLAAAGGALQARAAGWMPYPDWQVVRIEPRFTHSAPQSAPAAAADATIRINPIITDFETARPLGDAVRRGSAPPLGTTPPRAYVATGERVGVDPWLLYGVALQESQLKFGARVLPYPWTLCVEGRGLRFGDYSATLRALKRYVGCAVTNVDCGTMQVNWRWHSTRLGSLERALDPYPNLAAGAQILHGHYDERRSWPKAVALYHTGSDASAEQRDRGARYARQTLGRLARLGVRVRGVSSG